MDEIKNHIQNSRLRQFGHVMQMRDEMISKKMLNTKMEGKRPRGRPRTRWIGQIRKGIEIRGENTRQLPRKQLNL